MFRVTIVDAKGILAKHLIQSRAYHVSQQKGFLQVTDIKGKEHNYALNTVAYYCIDHVADPDVQRPIECSQCAHNSPCRHHIAK